MLLQTAFAHVPLKAFLQILEGQHERDHLLDENVLISFMLLQGMLIIIIMQTVSQSVSYWALF